MKKILVPTDFSEASESGLGLAKKLAKLSQGEILLLYVEEPVCDPLFPQRIKNILEDYNISLHQQAIKRLEEISERDLREFNSSFKIKKGGAVNTILETALSENIDIICMATEGWTKCGSTGSVTERVVRNSKVPVLVVPQFHKNDGKC